MIASELSELALRNKQETEEAQIRLETHQADLEEMKTQHVNLESEVTAAKAELDEALPPKNRLKKSSMRQEIPSLTPEIERLIPIKRSLIFKMNYISLRRMIEKTF